MATKKTKNSASTNPFAFADKFDEELENMEGVGTSSSPPRYWYSTGNYVLNRIISGSYYNGIPQGRVTDLAGGSGTGKSFISANLVAEAQRNGAYCLVIDSENALDDVFMGKIGVDTTNNYKYVDVTTIPQVTKIVSSFLKKYKAAYGEDDLEAPQVLILIDSLDMLITETELDHFEKGNTKGDQGQKNKQLKAMLRTFVQAIKHLNVAIVCTSQVYRNQDLSNGEGLYIVAEAVRYACSQIIMIAKKKLRDKANAKAGESGEVLGVRMVCEGYKTRFTKPFQKVEIEVPYDTGMDPYSGLIEVAKQVGVLTARGSRLGFADSEESWYAKDFMEHVDEILARLEAQTTAFLAADAEADMSEELETATETKSRRKAKVEASAAE